jgi:hypothetical protein
MSRVNFTIGFARVIIHVNSFFCLDVVVSSKVISYMSTFLKFLDHECSLQARTPIKACACSSAPELIYFLLFSFFLALTLLMLMVLLLHVAKEAVE